MSQTELGGDSRRWRTKGGNNARDSFDGVAKGILTRIMDGKVTTERRASVKAKAGLLVTEQRIGQRAGGWMMGDKGS